MRSITFKLVFLLVLPLLPAGVNAWLNPAMPPREPIALAEDEVNLAIVSEWEEEPLWVDARMSDAFETDHIPGAINLNMERFDEQMLGFLDVWQPGQKIVIYCDSRQCGASKEVANRLRLEMGIENIYVLKGGWQEWLDSKQ